MIPSPLNRRYFKILKTVEIAHPLTIYIFVHCVREYVMTIKGNPMDAPPLKRKCPNISKTVEIPIPKSQIQARGVPRQ
jgi:hypothetical protein